MCSGRPRNYHIWAWTQWLIFCKQHFQMHLLKWKLLYSDSGLPGVCTSTHFGLVTPYGDRSSGSTLAQVITWTNVDWSSVKSSDIHIRTISQEMPQPPITKIYFKVTYLKFHSNFPGANELRLKTSFVSLWLDNEKATSHCLNKNMTQLTNKNMHVQAPMS